MTKTQLRAFAAVLLCLWAGCGDDTGDGGAGAGGGGSGATGGSGGAGGSGGGSGGGEYAYSACSAAERVGGFVVNAHELSTVVPEDPYSEVSGDVKDGVVPTNVPEPVTTIGACTLVRGRNLTCTPECEVGTSTCGLDGTCVPVPRNQDVGTVTIVGLKDPVSMEPRAPINTYQSTGALQYPEAEEGVPVTLSATGGAFGAFELVAEGVGLFGLDESVTLADGMPMVVNWTPPAQAGRSHVLATLNIALHGGDPVRIECDAPDTGTLEIPAELISELMTYAFSGYPRLYLWRQAADSVELDVGCVDLTVAAREVLDVEIDGLTSCNDMHPCPMGQVCSADSFCE